MSVAQNIADKIKNVQNMVRAVQRPSATTADENKLPTMQFASYDHGAAAVASSVDGSNVPRPLSSRRQTYSYFDEFKISKSTTQLYRSFHSSANQNTLQTIQSEQSFKPVTPRPAGYEGHQVNRPRTLQTQIGSSVHPKIRASTASAASADDEDDDYEQNSEETYLSASNAKIKHPPPASSASHMERPKLRQFRKGVKLSKATESALRLSRPRVYASATAKPPSVTASPLKVAATEKSLKSRYIKCEPRYLDVFKKKPVTFPESTSGEFPRRSQSAPYSNNLYGGGGAGSPMIGYFDDLNDYRQYHQPYVGAYDEHRSNFPISVVNIQL